ncbi:MAG: metallophosphoesterase [Patescibacteria group bacterium]|nr:metallophosphoesterase [Patescibacteria group bacterium]
MYAFLLTAVFFLIFSHWLVYDFFARNFSVGTGRGKNILRLVFFLLPAGFIFSSILVRWQEIFLIKALYFIFSLWLGVLVNFLLAIGAAWLIMGAMEALGKKTNRLVFGIAVLAVVFLYSGYGVFNALTPAIKKITVPINGLSAEWRGKTIAHLSDLHLGEILGNRFLKRVVEKTNSLNPDIIAITGDLFDGLDGNLNSFSGLLGALKAPKGVFYVIGNHEIYLGLEEALGALEETGIRVLDDEMAEIGGLQVIGVSYPGLSLDRFEKNIKNNYDPEKPAILLYHAPVDILSGQANGDNPRKDIYLSPYTDFSAAKNFGIDLQLSGHTHAGQIFPFNIITGLIYGGRDYGLHRDGDFTLYATSGAGAWGPTMRTGSRSEIVLITLE